jgi:hypothetical protein
MDEPDLHDVDSRLRSVFKADVDASRRVAARALTNEMPPSPPRWRTPLAIVTVTAIALVVSVAGYLSRRHAAPPPSRSLTITSAGPLLVVESLDGRRWVVGPSTPRRSGNYTMVIAPE